MAHHLEPPVITNIEVKDDGVWERFFATQTLLNAIYCFVERCKCFNVPSRLAFNSWALAGDWTVGKEAARLNQSDGRIAFRFHARDLNLVMGPAVPGTSVRFHVILEGQPVTTAHGTDTDHQGNGTVVEQRLYQLIRQAEPIADRKFEIEFPDSGVEAFDFTFG
jgi:thioredoxin family protein